MLRLDLLLDSRWKTKSWLYGRLRKCIGNICWSGIDQDRVEYGSVVDSQKLHELVGTFRYLYSLLI